MFVIMVIMCFRVIYYSKGYIGRGIFFLLVYFPCRGVFMEKGYGWAIARALITLFPRAQLLWAMYLSNNVYASAVRLRCEGKYVVFVWM